MKSFKQFLSEARTNTYEIPDDSNFMEKVQGASWVKKMERKYKVKIGSEAGDMGLTYYTVSGSPSDIKKMLSDLGDDEEIFDMMDL